MRNKNKINSLKKGYIKVPYEVMTKGLSVTAMGLYMWLLSKSEDFEPNVVYIRRELKLSRNTVYKYLNELLENNIIRVREKGFKGRATKYELVGPKLWGKTADIEKLEKISEGVEDGE
jgi:predicted transcriptional regulator